MFIGEHLYKHIPSIAPQIYTFIVYPIFSQHLRLVNYKVCFYKIIRYLLSFASYIIIKKVCDIKSQTFYPKLDIFFRLFRIKF